MVADQRGMQLRSELLRAQQMKDVDIPKKLSERMPILKVRQIGSGDQTEPLGEWRHALERLGVRPTCQQTTQKEILTRQAISSGLAKRGQRLKQHDPKGEQFRGESHGNLPAGQFGD
jgi:hypothetical protein